MRNQNLNESDQSQVSGLDGPLAIYSELKWVILIGL